MGTSSVEVVTSVFAEHIRFQQTWHVNSCGFTTLAVDGQASATDRRILRDECTDGANSVSTAHSSP